MKKTQLRLAAASAMAVVALAGCAGGDGDDGDGGGGGGGGGGGTPPAAELPAAARQSVSGLIAVVKDLIAQTSESTEPLLIGDAALPTDDTAEPSN